MIGVNDYCSIDLFSSFVCHFYLHCALTLLVGQPKGHLSCKKLSECQPSDGVWRGYL